MKKDREEGRIQREIIRRALEQSRMAQEERERLLERKDTLKVFQEMTALTPVELEHIAHGVSHGSVHDGEGFFSVKNQILFTGISAFTLLGIPILTIWLI